MCVAPSAPDRQAQAGGAHGTKGEHQLDDHEPSRTQPGVFFPRPGSFYLPLQSKCPLVSPCAPCGDLPRLLQRIFYISQKFQTTRKQSEAPGNCNLKPGRCKVLTKDSTPRRGRRVLPVTLGRHHKPFGSARTARALRALDLAGALHALRRAERRGAREKGVDQDRRTIRDRPHQRVLRRQRGLEWVRVLRNVSRAAREGTRQRRAATRDPGSPARNRGSPAGSLAAAPL